MVVISPERGLTDISIAAQSKKERGPKYHRQGQNGIQDHLAYPFTAGKKGKLMYMVGQVPCKVGRLSHSGIPRGLAENLNHKGFY